MVSGEISSMDAISCEVRNPSKKWTKGTLLSILGGEMSKQHVRRKMSNQSHIVSLLHAVSRQVRETGLAVRGPPNSYSTGLEDITVIAIQRGGHLGNGTARHVDDSGKQLTRNLVHVGNHQHKSLGRRERRSQQTSRESSVEGSRSSTLRLAITRTHRDLPTSI